MNRINRMIVAAWLGFILAWAGIPHAATAAPDPVKPPGERIRELRQERVKALEQQLDGLFEQMAERKDTPTTYLDAIRELGEAEFDLADGRAAEGAALERTVKRLKEAEEKIGDLQEAGILNKRAVAQVKAARLKAEINLEKWKAVR